MRQVSTEQGMFFEDEESYDNYAEFKDYIETIVFGYRGIAVRTELPPSIKIRKGEKRSFRAEGECQAESFSGTDGLD